jgi:hypothetical protein
MAFLNQDQMLDLFVFDLANNGSPEQRTTLEICLKSALSQLYEDYNCEFLGMIVRMFVGHDPILLNDNLYVKIHPRSIEKVMAGKFAKITVSERFVKEGKMYCLHFLLGKNCILDEEEKDLVQIQKDKIYDCSLIKKIMDLSCGSDGYVGYVSEHEAGKSHEDQVLMILVLPEVAERINQGYTSSVLPFKKRILHKMNQYITTQSSSTTATPTIITSTITNVSTSETSPTQS